MDSLDPRTLLVPRGLPELSPLKFDLEGILKAESRIQEIATITVIKAPELMALFNKVYLDICNIISSVQFEFELSKKHADEVRAICLIDKVPSILKDKGLVSAKSPSGSEDLREAVLSLDKDYSNARERVIQLKCTLTLLEGKKESIDRAYSSVKKVYSDQTQYRHSNDLSVEPGSDVKSFFNK
jgi:hypothetical protein